MTRMDLPGAGQGVGPSWGVWSLGGQVEDNKEGEPSYPGPVRWGRGGSVMEDQVARPRTEEVLVTIQGANTLKEQASGVAEPHF